MCVSVYVCLLRNNRNYLLTLSGDDIYSTESVLGAEEDDDGSRKMLQDEDEHFPKICQMVHLT